MTAEQKTAGENLYLTWKILNVLPVLSDTDKTIICDMIDGTIAEKTATLQKQLEEANTKISKALAVFNDGYSEDSDAGQMLHDIHTFLSRTSPAEGGSNEQ